MSTRSYICAKQPDGTYKGVYCHYDGYLEYNGAMLLDFYPTKEDADKILQLGSLSTLKEKLEPDPGTEHSFENRQSDVTVAYGRDRGETDVEAVTVDFKELNKPESWIDYIYIHDGEKWKYFENGKFDNGFRDVDEDLQHIWQDHGFDERHKGFYGAVTDDEYDSVRRTLAQEKIEERKVDEAKKEEPKKVDKKETTSSWQKVQENRQKLIDQIRAEISKGNLEWHHYLSGKALPHNGETSRPYQGANRLYLALSAAVQGFDDPRWYTFNQVEKMGLKIEKGQKGTRIEKFTVWDKLAKKEIRTRKDLDEITAGLSEEERKQYEKDNLTVYINQYVVFNGQQVKGLEKFVAPTLDESQKDERCERILEQSFVPIEYSQSRTTASYDLIEDKINMPLRDKFISTDELYGTAFHEMSHATGAKTRLNRNFENFDGFGSESYAREEVVAELSSLFLQQDLGVDLKRAAIQNSAAYIQAWEKVLAKPDEFFRAIAAADKASKYIIENCSQAQKQEQETSQIQGSDKDLHKNTLVVNFYAGPGAGKTTAALEVTAALKKAGYDVEYVPEYAKELVREGKLDMLDDQKIVIDEQYKRLHNMAVSGVQIVVTDSPVLLGQVYGQGKIDEAYHNKIREYYDSFDNFNLRVVRAEGPYQQEGRVENEAQAKELDDRIKAMLKENKVFYGNYQRDEIEKTVERISQTYNRLYGEHKEKKEEDTKAFNRDEHIDEAVAGYMLENPNKSLRDSMYDVVQMSDDTVEEYADKYRAEKQPIMVPSQLEGWSDWSTEEIKNKEAREAAEWLLKNHLENEKDVKNAFYCRQTSSMSDDPRAEENDEQTILRVANYYKGKIGGAQEQVSKQANQTEKSNKENLLSPREYYAQKNAKRLDDLNANVPQEMKDLKNWCAFKTYYDGATGKKKKIILSPETGEWAKCNEPATWSTYEKAMQFAKERNCEGLSFALDLQNRIACVDLDHCIGDKGMRSNLCWNILNAAPNTYAEKSVSGKGVHVFFKADNVTLGCNIKDDVKGLECYDRSKFISMTGNVISKTTAIEDKPQKLIDLVREELGPSQRSETSDNQTVRKSSGTPFMFDSEVVEAIKRSKAGPDFERLYRGEDLCGDKSKSDAKLMSMLAFFTDCNPSQMKSIFESSGLYRESKGEKYVDRTIDFAIRSLKTRPSNLGKSNTKQQQKASGSQKTK